TSVIMSCPLRTDRQKPSTSFEPGSSALTPTTAIGVKPGMTVTSGQFSGVEGESLGGNGSAVGAELVSAGDDRGAFQQVQRHLHDGSARRLGEERARRPPVERAHRRAAPDLVVDAAGGVAVDRP